ncbi:MAG TPA: alpha-L-fucosidase [Flavisolibacter sp.]|nr:alpha-L-fucosidase [Flavisolibacter sp.]
MKFRHKIVITLLVLTQLASAQQSLYPEPYGVLPSEQQLRWHEMEMYVLVHFTPTTFENKEWGYGDADPKIFNPSGFNAQQIAGAAKAGGFKGLILVAKHHDGFCLWPTKTTSYNISQSPWKGGKGDMVKEFEMAARKAGLKYGVYCSPWDRNFPQYGSQDYVRAYRQQLKELYTNYGDLFITWFDGANGGDGYYGGAREKRTIDRGSYYGWDTTLQIVRRFQPGAVIFSDVGDVRWVGNEKGHAAETSWATFTPEPIDGKTVAVPGEVKYEKSPEGTRNGAYWKPAECDVPLRPGWFYHPEQDNKVKTPSQLLDLYFKSVGRGASLDLGLSPDTRGLLHDNDVASLKAFGKILQQTFATNHATTALVTATNVRGQNQKLFSPKNLIDGDRYSYWATDDAVTNGTVTLEWQQPVSFNIVRLRENIKLGQRIEKVEVDAFQHNQWQKIGEATSIGANRLIRLPRFITAKKIRIRVVQSPASIALSDVGIFKEPETLPVPQIQRRKDGNITITTSEPVYQLRYTTDGSEPTLHSPVFKASLALPLGGVVKARAVNSKNEMGEAAAHSFGISKKNWEAKASYEGKNAPAAYAIDDDPTTVWHTWDNEKQMKAPPQEVVVDMGTTYKVKAFSYLPRQSGSRGTVNDYEWQVSNDSVTWQTVAKGAFANIKANPVEQVIHLNQPVSCRYFKFIGRSAVQDNYVSAAEVGAMGQ